MTEEEYFRKTYPDSCYGERPLSPYWDFFQDGVEFGERQSENKIADLKETNAILSESASINQKDLEYKVSVIEQRNKKIAELKQKLEQTEKDLADYQFNYPKIKELEKENAELKMKIYGGGYEMIITKKDADIILLEKENAELKEQNRNYEQLIDNGSVTLAKERLKNYKQLTKAKKLLAKWVELYKPKSEGYPITPIQEQTEQFLKEIEK